MMMKQRWLFVITVLLFIAAVPTASADPGWWKDKLAFRIQDYADGGADDAVVSVGISSSYLTSWATDLSYPGIARDGAVFGGGACACGICRVEGEEGKLEQKNKK